jgi:hypothetical protein
VLLSIAVLLAIPDPFTDENATCDSNRKTMIIAEMNMIIFLILPHFKFVTLIVIKFWIY